MSSRKATALAVLLVVSVAAYLLACSQAAWSPDSKFVAFVSKVPMEGGDGSQLYVANVEKGEVLPLWNVAKGYIGPPAWSPDGKTLAVVSVVEETPLAPKSEAKTDDSASAPSAPVLTYQLQLVTLKDGKRRTLAEMKLAADNTPAFKDESLIEPQPQWSDDGKQLYWPVLVKKSPEVRVIDVETGKQTGKLDGVIAARLAPSGKVAVALQPAPFKDEKKQNDILLYKVALLDPAKMKVQPLPDGDKKGRIFLAYTLPAWSADSSKLIAAGVWADESKIDEVEKAGNPKPSLWSIVVADGKSEELVKDERLVICWADRAAKSDTVAFAGTMEQEPSDKGQSKSETWTVWLLKSDGFTKRIDSTKPNGVACHPVFSPDGTKLAYRTVGKSGDKEVMAVAVYDLASGAEKILAPKVAAEKKPAESQKPVEEKKPADEKKPAEPQSGK